MILRYEQLDRVEIYFQNTSYGLFRSEQTGQQSNREASTDSGYPCCSQWFSVHGRREMKEIRHFFSLKQVPFSQNLRPDQLFELPGLIPLKKRVEFAIDMRNFHAHYRRSGIREVDFASLRHSQPSSGSV